METAHERGFKAFCDDRMCRDRAFRDLVFEALQNMKAGAYLPLFVDSVVQKSFKAYDVYDACAVAGFVELLPTDRLVIVRIPMGRGPSPDAEVDENDAEVRKIEPPYSARFYGGKADADGYLAWDEPVYGVANRDGKPHDYLVPPFRVPLEVGTTTGSRSTLHMKEAGGLARWPYGHSMINVFLAVGEGSRIRRRARMIARKTSSRPRLMPTMEAPPKPVSSRPTVPTRRYGPLQALLDAAREDRS